MTELQPPEINIEQLKDSIRAAVARREAEGRATFIKASAELFELLSAELSEPGSLSIADTPVTTPGAPVLTPLRLQPDFVPYADDHYHVDDLLKYHDAQFIWNAYRALLKREPDDPGLKTYLEKLRSGLFNKIDVLASLRFSPEGRRNNVTVDGLRSRAIIRWAYRLPLLGYLIELAVGIIRLPFFIRNQRAVETHLIAQQDRTAVHLNNAIHELVKHLSATNQALIQQTNEANRELRDALTRLSESLSRSFSQLNDEQKRFARLQHQQLSALFLMQQRADRFSANGGGSVTRNYEGQHQAASRTDTRWDKIYANFQGQFRGDFEAVKESFRIYLPLLSDAGIIDEILDLGCGRGEWLQLLREAGLRARGIEPNKVLAARAGSQSFDVIDSEALVYLRGLPENSLNVVTAFHFVEHLGLNQLIELVSEIRRTLKPGGLLIVETPNPKNLVVGACNFYSDPTHRHPLFPETLEFLIKQLGFEHIRLEYLHPVEDSPFTGADAASQALNSWLLGARDYAITAYKPCET